MNDAEYIERARQNIIMGDGRRQIASLVERLISLEAEVARLRAVIRDIRSARFRQLHDSEADQYDAILKACEAALAAGGSNG